MNAEDSDIIAKLKETLKLSPDSGATAEQWDRWFDVSALDRDLRRKLSFHDLRRLGAHAVNAMSAPYTQLSAPIRKDGGLCARPTGSSADEWNVRLSEWPDAGNEFIAVQIAEAIEENVRNWKALAEERFAEIERARAIIEEQKAFREGVLTGGIVADLLMTLKKIAEGRGRFSTDQLTFASNTIDDMKELALEAIAKAEASLSDSLNSTKQA